MSKAVLVVVVMAACAVGIVYPEKDLAMLVFGYNVENQLRLRFECSKPGSGTDHPTSGLLQRFTHE